jgi:hypothetical protein
LKDDEYLRRLGFIPSPSSKEFSGNAAKYGYHGDRPNADAAQLDWTPDLPDNPNGLPVGFARLQKGTDPTSGEPYEDQLGLTCAACHTGHLEYKNVSIQFDGGPSMVNLGEVERAIGLSIGYTLKIPGRFSRFASRLEEIQGHAIDRKKLGDDLQRTFDDIFAQKELETGLLKRQNANHLDEGFGRLDALNRIGNQVFYTNFLNKKTWTLPDPALASNLARHDAPVSFPPIWDTPYFLWAQYDASVLNELVRNAGEALGVNARINMTAAAPGRPLFGSTVNMANILHFEELLRGTDPFKAAGASDMKFNGLVAPKWRDAQAKFPGEAAWATDDKLVEKGRDLYRRALLRMPSRSGERCRVRQEVPGRFVLETGEPGSRRQEREELARDRRSALLQRGTGAGGCDRYRSSAIPRPHGTPRPSAGVARRKSCR